MPKTCGTKRFWRILPAAVLAGCLLIALNGCIADRLVLGENTSAIPAPRAHRQIVRVGKWDVECWVERSAVGPTVAGATFPESPESPESPDPPSAYVLFFVGHGDRVERWIDAIAEDVWGNHHVEIWAMNWPGSGSVQPLGPPELARVGPAALAVYDAVERRAGDRPIFIDAGSFGTVAALCVAARRPVAGLILANPPPLRQLIVGHYGWWNLWLLAYPISLQVPADLDSIANARRCTAPAVFILAGADEIIPPQYHDMVYTAYAGPKRRIDMPGAKHHTDPWPDSVAAAQRRDVAWLWSQVQLPPATTP